MPDEPNLLDNLKTDDNGLIAAIVQDAASGQVLMVAWMDKEALRRTLEGGKACFYSRSRQKYWVKGETSGHFQIVKEIRADCDLDAVLLKVEQVGAACHAGYRSCFYREVSPDGGLEVRDERLVNPEDVY